MFLILVFAVSFLVSLIFWALASILDAVMDTIKDHWDVSIFKNNPKYDEQWWNPAISWKNKNNNLYWKIFKWKIKKPVQFTDAWHNLKMYKIISLACSAISPFIGILCILGVTWPYLIISTLILLIIFGVFWNGHFNIFYDEILTK